MSNTTSCPHCLDIQLERSAIHEFDGEATREQADELAAGERCQEHQPNVGSSNVGSGSQHFADL
jgi:hypothetical protein